MFCNGLAITLRYSRNMTGIVFSYCSLAHILGLQDLTFQSSFLLKLFKIVSWESLYFLNSAISRKFQKYTGTGMLTVIFPFIL